MPWQNFLISLIKEKKQIAQFQAKVQKFADIDQFPKVFLFSAPNGLCNQDISRWIITLNFVFCLSHAKHSHRTVPRRLFAATVSPQTNLSSYSPVVATTYADWIRKEELTPLERIDNLIKIQFVLN